MWPINALALHLPRSTGTFADAFDRLPARTLDELFFWNKLNVFTRPLRFAYIAQTGRLKARVEESRTQRIVGECCERGALVELVT